MEGRIPSSCATAATDCGPPEAITTRIRSWGAVTSDYSAAAAILTDLRIRSVRLLTNNPNKVAQLIDYGTDVLDRMGHHFPLDL